MESRKPPAKPTKIKFVYNNDEVEPIYVNGIIGGSIKKKNFLTIRCRRHVLVFAG